MPKGKKKKDDEPPGAPAWMVTYGDLMSLLLTFFVLLLSFSVMDESKITQAIESVQRALSFLPANDAVTMIMKSRQGSTQPVPAKLDRAARKLRRMLQVSGQAKDVKIEFDKDQGLKISLPSGVLFDTLNASIKAEAYDLLNGIADIVGEMDVPDKFVEIRGHTDSRPISTESSPFRDNMDLSYERARNVMLFMTGTGRLGLNETEAVACGPWQPIASNDSDAGRQANRRVELFVRGDFSGDTIEGLRESLETFSSTS